MIQRTKMLTWSVLHRMRLTMKMTQHNCISSTSKLITEMYGGHIPVMVDTVVDVLDPKDSNIYVDMTFGAGGHSKAILQRAPEARIVCLDQDPKAHESALALSKIYNPGQIMPCIGTFSSLPKIMADLNIEAESVDGFLFDVGASSMQFDTPERGFSLSKDGILDMRMDQGRENTVSAMDVVNNLEEKDLTEILRKYGDEKKAKQIARALVEWRYMFGKIRKTKQLVDIIESVFGEQYHNDKLNRRASVATRSFQALRIFVNNELNELHNGLVAAHHFLKPEGKCLALTFHSLEDRIVKRHFHGIDIDEKLNMSLRDKSRLSDKFRKFNDAYDVDSLNIMLNDKKWSPISKKIMHPNEEECKENPRARSAKLRAARKL
ncbi:probable methyltransferase-like protein 15 homolog [Mytilus edulis]|uniref:probable methyltransferase-like protein 15 homolog n=1 Tax=Mytilus edulis TaxID=6550 RepID=UPI0039F07B7D